MAAAPRPDIVLVLDAPAEVLLARKGEHDLVALERARVGYARLVADGRAVRLDATSEPELVRSVAIQHIWHALTTRWSKRAAT